MIIYIIIDILLSLSKGLGQTMQNGCYYEWKKEVKGCVCHFTLCMLMNKNHYTHTVWTAAREPGYFGERKIREQKSCRQKENNTQDSNVVPHRSTNWARACLTSLSRREAVLSCWYGRSRQNQVTAAIYTALYCTVTKTKTKTKIKTNSARTIKTTRAKQLYTTLKQAKTKQIAQYE